MNLASNGRVAASHFCYLLANCPFGTYDKKSSKLVLISTSHKLVFFFSILKLWGQKICSLYKYYISNKLSTDLNLVISY